MEPTLTAYFERTVRRCPERHAVEEPGRSITFGELRRKSRQLAAAILRQGGGLCRPVGVFVPKSIESVVCDMAITCSGNAYMNLDTRTPAERIKSILAKIAPAMILARGADIESLRKVTGGGTVILDYDEATAGDGTDAADDALIAARTGGLIDTDPYCIINTSGSTGTPKGVVLNSRGFVDFTDWAIETLGITGDERIGSLSPHFFDIYSFELCLLMFAGSTLFIIPEQHGTFPVKLIETLARERIDFIFWVPTIMVNVANLDILSRIPLPALKKVLFAGEVFPTRHLNYWRRHLPEAMFINLYGPIEITLDCTYYIVDREIPDDEPIPIGFPCRNTGILILTEANTPAAVNETGELCVRGTSLAMGYYNDPEKTAAAFVANPLNSHYPELIYRTGDYVYLNERGEIMFVGRKDFQVKHLGYRIDLSEVEHIIIHRSEGIDNACVLYDPDAKKIILCYEGAADQSEAGIRKNLSQFLPKYMLPTVIRHFTTLPRNPNGKIDRNRLKSEFVKSS
jgi:amino acid adenylation domain-containing protein